MNMDKQENDNQTLMEELPVTGEQANQTKGGSLATNETLVGVSYRPR
jgi:hypothetical protein